MKVSQGLNLFLYAPILYDLEVLIYLDTGFSIKRALFDSIADFHDEILLGA